MSGFVVSGAEVHDAFRVVLVGVMSVKPRLIVRRVVPYVAALRRTALSALCPLARPSALVLVNVEHAHYIVHRQSERFADAASRVDRQVTLAVDDATQVRHVDARALAQLPETDARCEHHEALWCVSVLAHSPSVARHGANCQRVNASAFGKDHATLET